jgi:hypothetical protein
MSLHAARLPSRACPGRAPLASRARRARAAAPCNAAMRVLNDEPRWSGAAPDGLALSVRLQRLILALQSDFIREDGSGVNYKAAASSPAFAEFAAATCELQAVEVEALGSEAERRCLFINLYNALTIHGLCTTSPLPSSPQKMESFWDTTAYRFGKRTLTLNDIEHGILRGNGAHPAGRTPHWPAGDERVSLALPLENRIHFALNCGAKRCGLVELLLRTRALCLRTAATAARLSACTHQRTWSLD